MFVIMTHEDFRILSLVIVVHRMEYLLSPRTLVIMTMELFSRQTANSFPIVQMWEGPTTLTGSHKSCIW